MNRSSSKTRSKQIDTDAAPQRKRPARSRYSGSDMTPSARSGISASIATVESTTMTDHVTGPDARGYPGLSHDAHAQDAHAYGLRHRRRAFVHARGRHPGVYPSC